VSGSESSRFLAELAGTALLVGIGTGGMVAASGVGGLPILELAVLWFLAVTIPILIFAPVSGAHINPLVTLGLVLRGDTARRDLLPYIVPQLVGAFAGTGVVLTLFGSGDRLGATVPTGPLPIDVVLEVTFTFLLVLSVFWIVDQPLRGPGQAWKLLPGFVVGVSTYLIGPVSGSSLNPARTLAPAVVSATYAPLGMYLVADSVGCLLAVALALGIRHVLGRTPASTAGSPAPPTVTER
jgi:glycerol uptake facilitator-like aquaporin